jgi:hypothetical protein
MVKRFKDEVILARWVVDAAFLHNFVRETRLRSNWYSYMPPDLLKECEKHATGAGLEVVVREDAVFVGEWGASNSFDVVQVHETWMQFMGDEGYYIAVPLVPGVRAEAERIAVIYSALHEKAHAEVERQFKKERARPTWNNRILNFVEAHIGWFMLGFFFVLIPLLLVLLGFLRGNLSW